MSDLPKLLEAISFAAAKHRHQRRKGANAEPYINHPLEVANILTTVGKISDHNILIAAVLHDTIEDTEATPDEITMIFGEEVCSMVLEVTDDKNLDKKERKQRQIEHAPHLSHGAKHIKLADKISNIKDILQNPPHDWSEERKLEYVNWGENVVAGLRGVNAELESLFDELIETARQNFK